MKQTLCLGIDGFDWDIAAQLMAQNQLPNLQHLCATGAAGPMRLVLAECLASSWATTLSGQWPDRHGVLSEFQPLPSGEGKCVTRSSSSAMPLIWDLIEAQTAELQTQVIAHPFVDRASAGMGKFVHCDYPGKAQYGGTWSELRLEWLQGYDPDEIALFADMVVDANALPTDALMPFIPDLNDVDTQKDRRPAIVAQGLSRSLSVHNLLTWQLQMSPAALTVSAYPLFTDLCCQFLAYQDGESIGDDNAYRYRQVVAATYGFFDVLLGSLLELLGNQASLVLLSHHGYKDSGAKASLPHMQRLALPSGQGFCLFSGGSIKHTGRWSGTEQVHIVPTLLSLMGQPVPDSLPGSVLGELLSTQVQASYDPSGPETSLPNWPEFAGSAQNREFIQQLSNQGYHDPLHQFLLQQRLEMDRQRLLNLCKVYTLKAQESLAVARLAAWINQHPGDLRVLLRLLSVLVLRGSQAKIIDLARHTLKSINPLSEQQFKQQVPTLARQTVITLLDGLIMCEQGNGSEGIDLLIRLTESHHQDIILLTLVAYGFLGMAQFDQARLGFQRILVLDKSHLSAWVGLMHANWRLKRMNEAVEAGLAAIDMRPANFAIHKDLSNIFEQMGSYSQALRHLELFLLATTGRKESAESNILRQKMLNTKVDTQGLT